MEKDETTRLFAYAGVILIIVSMILGVWIAVENRGIADEDLESSDAMDAENRTAFFYDRNADAIFFDLDKIYLVNPAPAHSGFNFFIMITGITFILYAFYNNISSGDDLTDKIAKLALLVMIFSLLLAVWVSATNYQMVKERTDEDTDFEKIRDKYETIVFFDYLNTALVFFGPALLLFSLYRERVPNPDALQKNLFMIGMGVMFVCLILAIISGFLTRKMAGADDMGDFTGWFKNKAFIAQFFPYLPYLGLGFMLFPFSYTYVRDRFSDSLPSNLTYIALVLIIIGSILPLYPAILFNDVANEYEDLRDGKSSSDEFNDVFETYYEGTAYCYFGTALAFLGIGLLLFGILFGHFMENNDTSNLQKLNILFMVVLIVGLILGIWAGVMKMDLDEDNSENFLTMEYLYMVLLFASSGMMMFLWTQKTELFRDVKYICPDCRDEVKYYPNYYAYFCTTCNELLEQPIEKRVKNCPDCRMEMDFVKQYHRWYCSHCREYKMMERPSGKGRKKRPAGARKRSGAGGAKTGGKRIPKCKDCMEPMKFISQYDRWYCYTCKRYGGIPGASKGASRPSGQKARPKKSGQRPASQWETFTCPDCGKTGEIKTNKRPLNINCSKCGLKSVLK